MNGRRKRSTQSEFSKPILAVVLICLIWVAFKVGLLGYVASTLVGISKPDGETNAGVIYRREMAKGANEAK